MARISRFTYQILCPIRFDVTIRLDVTIKLDVTIGFDVTIRFDVTIGFDVTIRFDVTIVSNGKLIQTIVTSNCRLFQWIQ